MRSATCSVSTEHIEQQSNRATEHSAGHVTQRSAVLAAGRDERRRYLTVCLRPHYSLIVLEPDDVLFMPLGLRVIHAVHTPQSSLMEGGML